MPGALEDYFRRRGQIAQHNARILAAQRGLMPYPDEGQAEVPLDPAAVSAVLRQVAGGGASGADGTAPMRPLSSHSQPAFDIPTLPPLGSPDSMHHQSEARATPQELMQLRQPRMAPMPSHDRDRPMPDFPPPPPEPTPPAQGGTQPTLGDEPDRFWTEGGTGDPVTSYSNVFGQSATFRPGTVIKGRGTVDPLREAEWRAMQAAIDDYSRKRMMVEKANQLPEGMLREMRADNPEAYALALARMQQGLAQGLQALGPEPSRALPSEVTRSAARATARGALEAQPYTNARDLSALLAEAERVKSPAYRDVEMGKARVGAEAGLQQPVLDKGAIDTARAVDINKARSSSLWDTPVMTPGQEAGLTAQPPGEPAATERAPAGSAGRRPGTGLQIRMPRLQQFAAQRRIPIEQAIEWAKSQDYKIVP